MAMHWARQWARCHACARTLPLVFCTRRGATASGPCPSPLFLANLSPWPQLDLHAPHSRGPRSCSTLRVWGGASMSRESLLQAFVGHGHTGPSGDLNGLLPTTRNGNYRSAVNAWHGDLIPALCAFAGNWWSPSCALRCTCTCPCTVGRSKEFCLHHTLAQHDDSGHCCRWQVQECSCRCGQSQC